MWTTVRLGPARTCAGPRPDARLLPVSVLASVSWRTPASGRGPALVRLDLLVPVVSGHWPPGPHGYPYLPGRGAACDVHLRADPDAPCAAGLAECADVLVSPTPLPVAAARHRVSHLLVRHPGCLVAAVPDGDGGCVIGVRDTAGGVGYAWQEAGAGAEGGPASAVGCFRAPPHVAASAVHAWSVSGGPLRALRSVRPYGVP
ncbi:hypothetical protein [Streptomyces sp. NEAU-W12]|uniref:hypothetical protein n=1 Tax=Streptomyces sp. NEAU-W12 TaxID=2994668 RepID=UPI00224AD82C|nr:hypothetical protein [Streptomyces sp. NEAU-W12]MCX2922101.1 hypothetical protein [Streptomyces sp. NEAU-W12]